MKSNKEIQLKINTVCCFAIKKLDLYKWILITFLMFITLSIFLFITSLSRELIQSCLVQVSRTTDFNTGLNYYIHNYNEILYILILLLVALFWFNFFRALSVVYVKHLNTRKFINSLKTEITEIKNSKFKFIIIKNKDNLAFTYGYFSPKVYISSNLTKELSKNEFQALLEHEVSHKKSYDPLLMLITLFIKELLPLTFLTNRVYKLLGLITELKADNYSILNSDSSISLLNLYLNMDKFQNRKDLLVNNFARSRIDLLISNKLPNIFPLIFTLITVLIILNFSTVSMAKADPLGKCTAQINQCLEIQSQSSDNIVFNVSNSSDVQNIAGEVSSLELTNCLDLLYTPIKN